MATTQKYATELIGTFWLTFGGCGSAALAAAFPELGIRFAGVTLAFGMLSSDTRQDNCAKVCDGGHSGLNQMGLRGGPQQGS
jgi:hypothetical protein